MARQETIEVKLQKAQGYDSTVKSLQDEANKLKATFESIKVGNATQQLNAQAAASRTAAQAAADNLRVQREQVNLDNARQRSIRDLTATQAEQARLSREQADLGAANLRVQREQVNLNNANTRSVRDLADANAANIRVQTEQVNLQNAQIRQQNLLNQGNQRHQTALRNLGNVVGAVNAAQAQSIQQMRQFIQNQNNLNNANVTATGTIRNAAGTFQTYNAAVTEAGGVTHNYRFAVDEATGAVYQLDRGIRSTSLTVRDLSSILRSVRTLIGFTGVAQSMRYAFTEMKSMSDEMIVYQKVTKASADEMERLRASAYESAKRYGQTPTDFLSAASEMARAGYKENSAAMADLATKTKLVGDITAEEASRFLLAVDAGYQYGGSIEKLANVLDMTNEVSNNFATNTAKISEGMTLVASLGAQANIPIEQLIAALGTMTAATQRSGSEMARALRFTILNVLGDTTTEVEEGVKVAAEEVNNMSTALQHYAPAVVNAAKQSGKLINPMEAIGALAKAYKEGLIGTQEELFKLSKDIAGQRYYNAFAALIENWDTMYQEMLDKEAMASGSADAEISVLVNSWTTKFNQLKTTWTELVNNSINEGFIKNLIDGTTHVLSFAGSLENLATMAGGALFAIRSLSAGIKNLRQPGALMNLDTFGGFNLATGIAGIGVAAYGIIKSAYEANQRALQEAAKKAAESAVASATTYTSLEELTKKYDEIAKDGIQEEKGELTELKSLQDQLNGLVGDQATAIDIVNGKYGETLTALKKLNEEQRKNLLETARARLSETVSSFIGADLNGDEYFGNYTGVSGLPGQSTALMDYINTLQYFRVSQEDGPNPFNRALYLTNKPTVDKDIIQFYTELQDLYNYIGSHNLRGEKAGLGEKTIGEEQNYTRMFSALGKFLQEVEKTAKPVQTAYESVETLSGGLEEIGGDGSGSGDGSANGAADAIEELTESVHTLTDSIEKATAAKTKFDEAMKTSKADAFKDYMEAFDTFQQELDAGRMNSTAMYAAARMMLGQEAYNATGGTYAGVMQAMYNRGNAGTVLDAYQMLNTEYVDKQGRTIEGFGAYELLRRSGVFGEGELTDANGNIFIPELTDAQYEQISAAYGGILVEVIMNALNALDQYDTKGETTDAATAPETAEANEETTESTKNLGESAEKASESVEDFSETVDEEKKEIERDETSERVAQSAEYADAQVQAEQEAATRAVAEARAQAEQEAQRKMQESADKLDGLISKIQAINEATISPELLDLLDGLGKVKDKYTIAIETTGDETATAEQKIQAISSALDEIEKNKKIALEIGLPDTAADLESAKASLIEEANGIISGVESSSELHSIMLNTRATAGSINHDLYMLISSAEASKKVSIPAQLGDTTQFKTDVGELTKDETKTITVSDNGTAAALDTALDGVTSKLSAINSTTPDENIVKLIDGISKIKDTYTFAIQMSGNDSATTEQKILAISQALDEIEKNKDLAIAIGLPDAGEELETAKSKLIQEANTIISGVEDSDDLHSILLKAAAGEGTLNSDLNALITTAEENNSVTIGATADTTEARTRIAIASQNRSTSIYVNTPNAGSVNANLNTVANPPEGRTAKIDAEADTNDAKTELEKAAEGRTAKITASAETTQAGKDLDAAAAERPATIKPELKDAVPVAQTLELLANPTINGTSGRTADINVKIDPTSESAYNQKMAELTEPADKTINIVYNDTGNETGETKPKQSDSSEQQGPPPSENQKDGSTRFVPDNLLFAVVAKTVDEIAGTNLSDNVSGVDRQEAPKYNEDYFKPVTPELVDEYRGAVETATQEGVQSGITAGLQDPDAWAIAQPEGGFEAAMQQAQDSIESEGPLTETVEVDADTSDAMGDVNKALEEISDKSATIDVKMVPTYAGGTNGNGGVSGGGGFAAVPFIGGSAGNYITNLGEWIPKWASGTQFHPGGIALVNDGNGPELLISNGRAFIANDGKPALVNLQRGAKVFTASETRDILGGGVPAYAGGVGNYGAIGLGGYGDFSTKTDYEAAKALAEETANGAGNEAQKEAKAFSDLKDLIDYIINRVGMALEEQTGIIDQQIAELRAQREAGEQQNELEERQKAVAEAQKDMIDALNERTVRYLGEDGKWHWMADARNVQTATEALEKANQALLDYEDEMAFDAQIDALEAQKTALEDEYKKITKAWEDIQYGVNTPTGDLTSLIAEIIATGSATDKKGAQTVQSLLIGQLLQGGIFKGNYSEALDSIAKATSGNPIMPGESTATLASLIATTAAMGTGTEVTDAMKAAGMGAVQGGAYSGVTGGGTQTNFNYFINGIQLGSDQAGQPLSEIMRNLTVYTNTGVT